MKNAKTLTYWILAAIEYKNPTNTKTNSPHGSKAYLDIQANFADISGTWE
jgi:hypothetical protein